MGFKVDKRLIKSRKWKKLSKKILNGEVLVTDDSNELAKAIVHKLMTVDGLCVKCKAVDELYEENENQMPQNIHCGKCYQRYAYCIPPEFGAWMIGMDTCPKCGSDDIESPGLDANRYCRECGHNLSC